MILGVIGVAGVGCHEGRKLNLVCCLFFLRYGSRGLSITFLGSFVNPKGW